MSLRRWEKWVVSESTAQVLWDAKKSLRVAWSYDQQYSKTFPMKTGYRSKAFRMKTGYPVNTAYQLSEILARLSKSSQQKGARVAITEPEAPKRLADLVPEGLVAEIWEMNHTSTYNRAIAKAGGFGCRRVEESSKIFGQILKTIEIAYIASRFGDDLLPKPKVNILHRGLKRIAEAAGLYSQTVEGFSEFLDDLCPCGLKRHNEAVRKLYSRSRKAAP